MVDTDLELMRGSRFFVPHPASFSFFSLKIWGGGGGPAPPRSAPEPVQFKFIGKQSNLPVLGHLGGGGGGGGGAPPQAPPRSATEPVQFTVIGIQSN